MDLENPRRKEAGPAAGKTFEWIDLLFIDFHVYCPQPGEQADGPFTP